MKLDQAFLLLSEYQLYIDVVNLLFIVFQLIKEKGTTDCWNASFCSP